MTEKWRNQEGKRGKDFYLPKTMSELAVETNRTAGQSQYLEVIAFDLWTTDHHDAVKILMNPWLHVTIEQAEEENEILTLLHFGVRFRGLKFKIGWAKKEYSTGFAANMWGKWWALIIFSDLALVQGLVIDRKSVV